MMRRILPVFGLIAVLLIMSACSKPVKTDAPRDKTNHE